MTWFKSPGFYTFLDFHSFFFIPDLKQNSIVLSTAAYLPLCLEQPVKKSGHKHNLVSEWSEQLEWVIITILGEVCDLFVTSQRGLVSSGSSSAHFPSIQCAWAQDEDVFWTPNANLLPSFPVDATNGWLSVASEPWEIPVIFFLTTSGRCLPPPERRLDVFFLSAASFYVALQLGTLAQPAAAKAH